MCLLSVSSPVSVHQLIFLPWCLNTNKVKKMTQSSNLLRYSNDSILIIFLYVMIFNWYYYLNCILEKERPQSDFEEIQENLRRNHSATSGILNILLSKICIGSSTKGNSSFTKIVEISWLKSNPCPAFQWIWKARKYSFVALQCC